jgi:hypothetical protein
VQTISKEADNAKFEAFLDQDSARSLLKLRILAIKQAHIDEIKIQGKEKVQERFLSEHKYLKPRSQRDIKRLLSLVKCFALLNLWWREKVGSTIIADETDIEEAFKLWGKISASQEMGLPPIVHQFYLDVIVPLFQENSQGKGRQEILTKYYAVYKRTLDKKTLEKQMLPMLESVGLIYQQHDKDDRRKMLVYPPAGDPISQKTEPGGNRDNEAGVESEIGPKPPEKAELD